jgi:hypothetical protein
VSPFPLLKLLGNGVVAPAHLFLQLRQAFGELLVDAEQLPKPDEGPHDLDVDLHGPWASQNAGKHGHPLLGEGEGQVLAVPAATTL